MSKKIQALAEFLTIPAKEIKQTMYDGDIFETADGAEYLVLTDREANKRVKDTIAEEVWAFNASFIMDETGLTDKLSQWEREQAEKSLKDMQERACEGCNAFILALINGSCKLNKFVKDAVEADGRGHFLATYDDKENEQGNYFIYRIN